MARRHRTVARYAPLELTESDVALLAARDALSARDAAPYATLEEFAALPGVGDLDEELDPFDYPTEKVARRRVSAIPTTRLAPFRLLPGGSRDTQHWLETGTYSLEELAALVRADSSTVRVLRRDVG